MRSRYLGLLVCFLVTAISFRHVQENSDASKKTPDNLQDSKPKVLIDYFNSHGDDFFNLCLNEKFDMQQFERETGITFLKNGKEVSNTDKRIILSAIGRRYFHYEPSLLWLKTKDMIASEKFRVLKTGDTWQLELDKNRKKLFELVEAKPFSLSVGKNGEVTSADHHEETEAIVCFSNGRLLVVDLGQDSVFWFYPNRVSGIKENEQEDRQK